MIRRSAAPLGCGVLLAAMALGGCGLDNNPPAGLPIYQSLATADAKLDVKTAVSMISGYRKNNGLGPVSVDPELMKLAEAQAHAMATRNKLSHDVWRPFADRIRDSTFDASTAVENVAAGYDNLAEAFAGWRESPQHRANMLNPAVTKMGIAAVYAPASRYKVFWSLIMAKPDDQHQSARAG